MASQGSLPEHPKLRHDERGNLLLNFGAHGQEVELACFSGDGTRLLTVEDVGTARVWDVDQGEQVGQIRPSSPLEGTDAAPSTDRFVVFIEAVALDRSGDRALLGLNDGTAGLFSVIDGERQAVLHDPDQEPATDWQLVRAVCFSADGQLVAVGFAGRSVGVWDANSGQLRALVRAPRPDRLVTRHSWARDTLVTSVSFSTDGRYLFAGAGDLTALIWSLESGEVVFEAHEHAEAVVALAAQADVDGFAWATTGGSVWRAGSAGEAERLLTTGENWAEVAFSPGGRSLLSRSADGLISKWRLANDDRREHLQQLPAARVGFADDAISMAHDPTGRIEIFPVAGDRLGLRLDERTETIGRGEQLVRAIVSPDGKVVATEGWSKQVEIWKIPSGRLVHELDQGDTPGCLAFSRDGRRLAVGLLGEGGPGAKRPIHVWEIGSGRKVHTLSGHTHQVQSLAFGPDGTWLVSASLDRSVRLWALRGGWLRSASEIGKLAYEDLEFDRIHALSNGTILVFRKTSVEAWRRLDELMWSTSVPAMYRRRWLVTPGEDRIILQAGSHRFMAISLADGTPRDQWVAPMPRPQPVPGGDLADADKGQPTAAALCWHGPGGPHLHVGDGPRGWAVALMLFGGNLTVVPYRDRAATICVGPEGQEVVEEVPFAGRMRASCITEDHVLLVNSEGRVFRTERTPSKR